MMNRRNALVTIASLITGLTGTVLKAQRTRPSVDVYKDPTCGCCVNWVAHLRTNGFTVKSADVANITDVKAKYKVPGQVRSCHTAVVDSYVIEGHVPAADIQRLLKERPAGIIGLAVPGMPVGSPGMEGANPQAYDVLAFDGRGRTQVFATHGR
jgi:hypothetical protein